MIVKTNKPVLGAVVLTSSESPNANQCLIEIGDTVYVPMEHCSSAEANDTTVPYRVVGIVDTSYKYATIRVGVEDLSEPNDGGDIHLILENDDALDIGCGMSIHVRARDFGKTFFCRLPLMDKDYFAGFNTEKTE